MTHRLAKRSGWLLAALLIVATALRVPGLFSDFWLDEIWTLKIVLGMDSAWDVFREVRHSNNHHLNTLWFYLIGDHRSWIPYRLPALAAGVASVWLAWRIGARRGRCEAAFAAGLCASSYLLVHYSSEARGYAPVVFFGLAAFALLPAFFRRPTTVRAAGFWSVTGLGFLSHLMYLHVLVAAGVWALVVLGGDGGVRRVLRDGLRLFAPPALFLLAFYWFDVRLTKIGEGPELDAGEVFVRALSYAIGGPPSGPLALAAAVAGLGLFGASVLWWQRQGRAEWVFLAVVIFASPAVSFALMRPEVFFVRYFLVSTAFGLIALAGPLAEAWTRGGAWRAGVALGIAAVLLGNGLLLTRFYRYGRGDYLSTVRMIADSAGSRLPTVSSDHRFRNSNVIRFYNRYVPVDRRLVYVEQDEAPDWLLLHRIGALGRYAPDIERGEERYVLVRVAPYSDLSGWSWLVYRRASPRTP